MVFLPRFLSFLAEADCAARHSVCAQGDNDPVDVVEIGSQALETGGVYQVKPLAILAMIGDFLCHPAWSCAACAYASMKDALSFVSC